MPADRWNEALEAASQKCEQLQEAAYTKYARGDGNEWRLVSDELGDAHRAILALREADQRGAALAGGESRPAAVVPVEPAAPHHPGGQESGHE